MTLYADKDTRKTWRVNYGIPTLRSSRDAHDFWGRRGGAPSGCVLALAHAIEQIDADEVLMRQALEALDECMYASTEKAMRLGFDANGALRERLK